ncbi:MAG: ABC transporter substrate-binding protein [Lachnospiraceae bacterium]|nr:ABC transporter substrate-binding protein [Lachnospiraceae bacterium]
MKKKFSITLMALLLVAALGGCAGGKSSGNESSTAPDATQGSQASVSGQGTEDPNGNKDSKYGGKVVVGVQQDIDSLDPHKATAAGTKEILFNIFEGLLKVNENGSLICAVASDYSVSEDGLTYTFTLRDNVKFHNGANVTAEDVKYSLERASGLLDGTVLVASLATLKSVDVIDEHTVQVTTGSANLELIYSFTTAIIPKGSGEAEGSNPIGTGPFSFVSYKPQEGLVVKKNPDYWQEGLPYLDEVNFKIVSGADSALLELKGHSIDLYSYLTDSQAAELANDYQILAAPSDALQAMFLNNAVAPFDNVKVRQAVCYAMDRDLANEFVTGGNGAIISAPMLPTLKDYYVDLNGTYGSGANIEKAKQLLAEAGYPNGIEFSLIVPSNYEAHVQTAEVLADQMQAAGINCKIELVEWNTWLEDVYKGRNYQASICAITSDMTPSYLMVRFQSDHKKNFINFSSAEYDEVYKKAEASMNLQEKANFYKQAEEIFVKEAGTAFIQDPPITIALNKNLAGYKFYPIYVQDMSTVYFNK